MTSVSPDVFNQDTVLKECDEFLSRLRLSVDLRIEKMNSISEDMTNDQLWSLITHALEAYSLLDVS